MEQCSSSSSGSSKLAGGRVGELGSVAIRSSGVGLVRPGGKEEGGEEWDGPGAEGERDRLWVGEGVKLVFLRFGGASILPCQRRVVERWWVEDQAVGNEVDALFLPPNTLPKQSILAAKLTPFSNCIITTNSKTLDPQPSNQKWTPTSKQSGPFVSFHRHDFLPS